MSNYLILGACTIAATALGFFVGYRFAYFEIATMFRLPRIQVTGEVTISDVLEELDRMDPDYK